MLRLDWIVLNGFDFNILQLDSFRNGQPVFVNVDVMEMIASRAARYTRPIERRFRSVDEPCSLGG